MLVMMQYMFNEGDAARNAIERFVKWAPSDGFEIKGGWHAANNGGGFLLLEVATNAALLEFSSRFQDMNQEIRITPVVELGEAIPLVLSSYAWVDSVA